jgi:hypothetical protein
MIAGLREYDATFASVAFTTAVDVWEVNGHASRVTWVTGIEIGQSTEVGDAQEEQLVLSWIQTHSTSGSGGAAVTPSPNSTDAAFGGTVERMNTTQATGGSPITRRVTTFNVRAGYVMIWDPTKWLMVPAGGRLVLTLPAPADSVTLSSTIYLAEAG